MKKLSLFPLATLSAVALAAASAFASDAPALPRPLTLEAALTYASAHNPSLLRTQEQIREQEGVLVTARAGRLPTVATSGSLSRTDRDRLESPLYDNDAWSVSVTVTQALYAGGALQAQTRSQKDQLEAARLAFTAALNDTLLSVRQQFYTVLLDRQLIAVQEEALRVLEGELANARHRREAGSGSDFDVLRAEVAVANARPSLIRARNAYVTAQNQLRTTLGFGLSLSLTPADLDVQGELAVPHRDIALADALAAAETHRPELLQQDRLLKAAAQGVVSARSGYLPTVSASAGYGWTKPSLLTTSTSDLHGWNAGLSASWNIFDSKATAGRVSQARSRVEQSRHTLDERQLSIALEVRNAHISLVESDELLRASEQTVAQARESLRLAQARHQAGTATQLDVLTAQSALTESQANHATSQHDYAVALATLQRAMGSTAL